MPVSTKPVKGTRDFDPVDAALREQVKEVILQSYRSFGYYQIETPVMENIDILQNADGGENLSMLFKVLKRGEKLKLDGPIAHENDLVDYGLRFDLTLPLARFYANTHTQLPKPFKSIQMGYVWRAERSQKGRYRQFFQCDIDCLGSNSHTVEIELINASATTLTKLGFNDFTVRVNDRRILETLATHCGVADEDVAGVLVTLDKLDKIGVEGIVKELEGRQLEAQSIEKLTAFLNAYTNGDVQLNTLSSHISGIEDHVISELTQIIETADALSNGQYKVMFDLSLVRGMGYYTGPIFEVASEEFGSSLAGGGRYDNMIGKFLKNTDIPACGFSIGFERILYILQEQNRGLQTDTQRTRSAIIYDPKQANLPQLFAAAAKLRSNEHDVSLEIRQKNLKLQLASLKKIGVTQFCALSGDSLNIELKPLG